MPLPSAFTHFRTCYQHPAGEVGVAITTWLLDTAAAQLLPPPPGTPNGPGGVPVLGAYRLTAAGLDELSALGIDCTRLAVASHHKACADYTVRLPSGKRGVPHVGGRLGAQLAQWLQTAGYAQRLPQPSTLYQRRTLQLTATGRKALTALGIPLPTE